MMKELTKAEDQIMRVLWKIQRGVVRDIINQLPEPKPAYNTVSTIIRILEKKNFVGHKAFGKTHEYFPLISKSEYSRFYLNNFVSGYFGNSFQNLVSFFAKENNLSVNDIDDLMKEIKKDLDDDSTD